MTDYKRLAGTGCDLFMSVNIGSRHFVAPRLRLLHRRDPRAGSISIPPASRSR